MTIKQRARRVFMLAADQSTRALYRLTRGRVGGKQLRYSILVLHASGRKTGRTRSHALMFIRDGERYVVCASNFGAPHHPSWFLNLLAQPGARIEDGPKRLEVLAEVAGPEERARLWQRWVAVRPQTAGYERDAGRELPMVILRPISPAAAAVDSEPPQ